MNKNVSDIFNEKENVKNLKSKASYPLFFKSDIVYVFPKAFAHFSTIYL